MTRSFTQRLLGGVCGGFAEFTRLPASFFRAMLIVLSVLTSGFALLSYLALWWILPLRVPTRRQSSGILRLLLAILVIAAMSALWWGREMPWLMTAGGASLFLPATLLVLGVALLMRQAAA